MRSSLGIVASSRVRAGGGVVAVLQSKLVDSPTTITFDTKPTSGSLLLCRFGARSSSHAATDISTGWTSAAFDGAGVQRTHIFYRVADGSTTDESVTISNSGTSNRSAILQEISGFVSSGVLDVTATTIIESGDPIAIGPTPTSSSDVVAFAAISSRARPTYNDDWYGGFTRDWIGSSVAGGAWTPVSAAQEFTATYGTTDSTTTHVGAIAVFKVS